MLKVFLKQVQVFNLSQAVITLPLLVLMVHLLTMDKKLVVLLVVQDLLVHQVIMGLALVVEVKKHKVTLVVMAK